MELNVLYNEDCLEGMRKLPDDSVDSAITDPPYHLTQVSESTRVGERGFMGKTWDGGDIAHRTELWSEVLRVLKPGGHLLSFGGSRTYHRMASAIEDAGFEIRDQLMWIYGSGFPKSLNVSAAIDKHAGLIGEDVLALKRELIRLFDDSGKSRKQIDQECEFRACNYLTLPLEGKRPDPWINILPSRDKWETIKRVLRCVDDEKVSRLDALFTEAEREVLGRQTKARSIGQDFALPTMGSETKYKTWDITSASTDAAKQWNGWGTALKPSHEPIVLARKPLSEGTVAANVLKHGTGAINIDASRIGTEARTYGLKGGENLNRLSRPGGNDAETANGCGAYGTGAKQVTIGDKSVVGRWPANVIHDGSDEVLQFFPSAPGQLAPVSGNEPSSCTKNAYGERQRVPFNGRVGEATAEKRYTVEGSTNFAPLPGERRHDQGSASRFFYCAKASKRERGEGNGHPTVKPIVLMQYLVRLVTPPGGVVLDPFAGSGTTLLACAATGANYIGFERDPGYFAMAQKRIAEHAPQLSLVG